MKVVWHTLGTLVHHIQHELFVVPHMGPTGVIMTLNLVCSPEMVATHAEFGEPHFLFLRK
jgi:hypothetical protein